MKSATVLLTIFFCVMLFIPIIDARVDAVFTIKDEYGVNIYMITPENQIIYGNILVDQKIRFDASKSNSGYPIDRYHWDFNGDGKYDRVTNIPTISYSYGEAGVYNASLLAVASSAPPAGDGDTVTHVVIVVEKFIPPSAFFIYKLFAQNETAISYLLNANMSYDKDGYINWYNWDVDGDNIYDFIGGDKEIIETYTSNGYYPVTLEVVDFDGTKNKTTRVLRINNFDNSFDEISLRYKSITSVRSL